MIESRREKKEDGLRSRLPEARRCAEPEREKRRLAAATLRANGEAEGVDPFAPCLRWGGPGSHWRCLHGIGSPMRRALVSGEERLRGPQRGRAEGADPFAP